MDVLLFIFVFFLFLPERGVEGLPVGARAFLFLGGAALPGAFVFGVGFLLGGLVRFFLRRGRSKLRPLHGGAALLPRAFCLRGGRGSAYGGRKGKKVPRKERQCADETGHDEKYKYDDDGEQGLISEKALQAVLSPFPAFDSVKEPYCMSAFKLESSCATCPLTAASGANREA